MARRIDTLKIDNVTKNTVGVITGNFRAARCGVFPYMDYSKGEIVYELKHPDHMLKPEAVGQLNHMPITDDHPWFLVNLSNITETIKGLTGSDAKAVNNEFSEVSGAVFDPTLGAKMLTGDQVECSLGFECDLIEEPGEWQGQHYDRIQTNYRYNHLAVVKEGRCGPDCKALLDSAGGGPVGIQLRMDAAGKPILPQEQENKLDAGSDQTVKVKIDQKEFDVSQEVADRLKTLEDSNTQLVIENAGLKGTADAAKVELQTVKTELDGLKANPTIDPAKMDQAISAKLALVQDAALFGVEVKMDGTDKRSDRDIKIACVKTVNAQFDGTGKDDAFINAYFDGMKGLKTDTGAVAPTGDNQLQFLGQGQKDSDDVAKLKADRLNLKATRNQK